MSFLGSAIVFVVMSVSLGLGARAIERKQVRTLEKACRCRCAPIDDAMLVLTDAAVAKKYAWFTSSLVCLSPDDPAPSAHLLRLQEEAVAARRRIDAGEDWRTVYADRRSYP